MPINAAATACVRALGFRDSRLQSDNRHCGEARSVPVMRDAHLGISGKGTLRPRHFNQLISLLTIEITPSLLCRLHKSPLRE
jgi:hypothetical protein